MPARSTTPRTRPRRLRSPIFYKGDEGFGSLDGLRFDAELGKIGEKAGANGADGQYVEPRSHIIVTTQTLFERWLHVHKDWWDKGLKNVPQQIGAALKDESFYTQAVSSGSAVINFNILPMAKPDSAIFAHGILAGRTQSEVPDAADEVFVSALANGKVYIGYGSIDPEVKIPECMAIRADYNKRSAQADDDFRFKKIDEKPMTGSATSDNREKTLSSAASAGLRHGNRHLSRRSGRHKRCWRRRSLPRD